MPPFWCAKIVRLDIADRTQGEELARLMLRHRKPRKGKPSDHPELANLRECHIARLSYGTSLAGTIMEGPTNANTTSTTSPTVPRRGGDCVHKELSIETTDIEKLGERLRSVEVILVVDNEYGTPMTWKDWVAEQRAFLEQLAKVLSGGP